MTLWDENGLNITKFISIYFLTFDNIYFYLNAVFALKLLI